MQKTNWKEIDKMSKMPKEEFDKYSYTQSAKDKLSQIGKPPKQKDSPRGYDDYMLNVRKLRAQSQSGGTIAGERKAFSKLENAATQSQMLKRKYNLMKTAGEMVGTFDDFVANELNERKRIDEFNERIRASMALNPKDKWTLGGGKYTRQSEDKRTSESGDYLGSYRKSIIL